MAKAILEFDLNDPDDLMAHTRAVKSLDMALAIWDMVFNTKKKLEWEIENDNLSAYDTLDKVYEKFWEILKDRDINPDNIVQ